MIPPPPYNNEKQRAAYVYLLRSIKINKFYLGWTTDLKRRLDEHNSGKSYYTKSRGPWELINYETYSTVQEAKK